MFAIAQIVLTTLSIMLVILTAPLRQHQEPTAVRQLTEEIQLVGID
jgi:hypothetical protein